MASVGKSSTTTSVASKASSSSSSSSSSSKATEDVKRLPQMTFITVTFGADETVLLNPSCAKVNFTNCLYERLCQSEAVASTTNNLTTDCLDLSTVSGHVIGLRNLLPLDFVTPLVAERGLYLPVVASSSILSPPSKPEADTPVDGTDETGAAAQPAMKLEFVPLLSPSHSLYEKVAAILLNKPSKADTTSSNLKSSSVVTTSTDQLPSKADTTSANRLTSRMSRLSVSERRSKLSGSRSGSRPKLSAANSSATKKPQ